MKKNIEVKRVYNIINGEKVLYWEYKYDDNGNIIYMKDYDGSEHYFEYDGMVPRLLNSSLVVAPLTFAKSKWK